MRQLLQARRISGPKGITQIEGLGSLAAALGDIPYPTDWNSIYNAIIALKAQVTSLTTLVKNHATTIENRNRTIVYLNALRDQDSATITTLTAEVQAGKDAIASLATQINTLTATIKARDATITTLNAQIATYGTRITSLEASVAQIAAFIGDLKKLLGL